jgi:hypothetical protein
MPRGEQDIEKVRAAALELQRRNARLEAENAVLLGRITALTRELATATDKDRQLALGLEIRRINEQLGAKNRELFGSSRSERRVAAEKEKSEEEKPKAKGHGPTKQQRLPVTEVPHKREDAAAPCPAWPPICEQVSASEGPLNAPVPPRAPGTHIGHRDPPNTPEMARSSGPAYRQRVPYKACFSMICPLVAPSLLTTRGPSAPCRRRPSRHHA